MHAADAQRPHLPEQGPVFDGREIHEKVGIRARRAVVEIYPHLTASRGPFEDVFPVERVEDRQMNTPDRRGVGQERLQTVGGHHHGDVRGGVEPGLHALKQAGPRGLGRFVTDVREDLSGQAVFRDERVGQGKLRGRPAATPGPRACAALAQDASHFS